MGLSGVALEYTGGEGGWLGDVPRFRLDVTAINRLGWRARYTSEGAVALAIEASLAGVGNWGARPGGRARTGASAPPSPEATCRL